MERNALSSEPPPHSDASSNPSDSSIRSTQFNVVSAGQRLFEASYSNSLPGRSDQSGRGPGADKDDAYAALFRSKDQPKEQAQSRDQAREVARGSADDAMSSGDNEPAAVSKYLNKYKKAPPDRVRPDSDDTPKPPQPVNPPQPDNPNPNPRPPRPGPGPRPPRPGPGPRPRPDNPEPNPDVPRPVVPPKPSEPGKIDDIDPPTPPAPRPVVPVQPDNPNPRPGPNPRPPGPGPEPCPGPKP